jgi:MFS family permease
MPPHHPTRLASGSRRFHYAWITVAVASMICMIISPVRFAISMLVPYLQSPQGFGWSYFEISIAFALQWVATALISPLVGWLGDQYGVRRIMLLGAGVFIVGMVFTGSMTRLWQFYLFFGILLAVPMTICQVSLVAGVAVWFRTHMGMAMGIMQAVQGLGTVVAIPLVSVLLAHFGLAWTFWGPGLVGGVLLLLLIRLFYNEPAQIGLRPLGASSNEPIQRLHQGSVAQIRARIFLRQAQRTGAFWNLIGIHFWGCVGHNSLLLFLPTIAMARGLTPSVAAGVYATLNASSLLTRFAVPILADSIGSKKVMAYCFSLQTFPILLLFFAQEAWIFFLFAILFGIGVGGEVPIFPVISRQYYGYAPMSTLYGWQNIGNGVGMALGPALGGLIWTQTGDDIGILALSFVASLTGVLSILVLPSTSRCLLPRWEEQLPPEARSGEMTSSSSCADRGLAQMCFEEGQRFRP